MSNTYIMMIEEDFHVYKKREKERKRFERVKVGLRKNNNMRSEERRSNIKKNDSLRKGLGFWCNRKQLVAT